MARSSGSTVISDLSTQTPGTVPNESFWSSSAASGTNPRSAPSNGGAHLLDSGGDDFRSTNVRKTSYTTTVPQNFMQATRHATPQEQATATVTDNSMPTSTSAVFSPRVVTSMGNASVQLSLQEQQQPPPSQVAQNSTEDMSADGAAGNREAQANSDIEKIKKLEQELARLKER